MCITEIAHSLERLLVLAVASSGPVGAVCSVYARIAPVDITKCGE